MTTTKKLDLFAKLQKVDVARREVWGVAVAEVPDASQEIFDYDSSKPYFENWSTEVQKDTNGASLGNLRSMHGKTAAGKLIALDFNDSEKAIHVGTKVVDDNEWEKVLEGVYTGFSIGGKYLEKWEDGDLTRYTAKPSELSLVDRPCVPSAKFYDVVKADGEVEKREFQHTEEESPGESGKDDDGSGSDKEIDLKKYMGENVWDARLATDCLDDVYYLLSMEIQEKEENPEQVEGLKKAIEGLKAFIASEIQEKDQAEIELAEKSGDLEKSKTAETENLSKIAELEKDRDKKNKSLEDIRKACGDAGCEEGEEMTKFITDLAAEVEKLKSEPADPKASLHAVTKDDETGASESDDDLVKDAQGNVNDVASEIKKIHQSGAVIKY